MARGRMISRSLGTASKKYARLAKEAGRLGEFAQALFPLLIVNADDFGRQPGDAFTIKYDVFSISPRSEQEFELALKAMQQAELIQLYEVNGSRLLQILNFEREQPGLRFDKRTKSRFPAPPEQEEKPNEISDDGKLPESPADDGKLPLEEKRTRREEKIKDSSATCALSQNRNGAPAPPNGRDAEPPVSQSQEKWPSPEALVSLYNEKTPDECPAVTVLSPGRREKARSYLRMFPERQFWESAFLQMHRSQFLRGQSKPSGARASPFLADFDWLLRKGEDRTENIVKVHDGKYHD